MKRIATGFAAFFVLACWGAGCASGPDTNAAVQSRVTDVRALLKQMSAGYAAGDVAALSRLWAKPVRSAADERLRRAVVGGEKADVTFTLIGLRISGEKHLLAQVTWYGDWAAGNASGSATVELEGDGALAVGAWRGALPGETGARPSGASVSR